MSWFEEWFDSPLYEKLYSNRNEEEAILLADLIGKIIPKNRFSHLLDLGCGRGRHSLTLAERGYNVTGTDLSPSAIEKATSLALERELTDVRFEVRDMRDPLDVTFDAIVNLFTTFGYFLDDDENRSVIQSVSTMLKSEGVFVMDYLNPAVVAENLISSEEGEYGSYHYKIQRHIENEMVFKTIRFEGADLPEPVEYQERVKLYELGWFKTEFRKNGLNLINCYGNYKGAPYSEKESPRMLMVAQKL